MDELSYRQLAEKFLAALRDRKVQFGRAASAATAGQSIQILRDGLPPIRARAQNNVSPGDACTLFVLDNGEVRAFGQHASDSSELTRTLRYRRHREEPLTQIEEQVLSLLLYEQPALTGLLLYQKTASSRLTALFTRRKKSRGQVAILYAVIERREGPHPEELCPCDRRWTPTSNGCVPVCTRDGEFISQQACEAFRANPPVGAIGYDYRAIRLWPSTETYTAGSPYGQPYYSNYYNLFIVEPLDGGSEITDYDEYEGKWYRDTQSGRQHVNWWDVHLTLVGGHDRYTVPGAILGYTSRSNINWNYPLLYNNYPWELGGNGLTPPPTGKLFQSGFHWSIRRQPFGLRSKIPRYRPEDLEVRAERDELLPAFAHHGRVDSWQVITIPGQPPFIPAAPRTPSPTQQNSHYVAKIYFKLDEEEKLVGEYLLPTYFHYNLSQGGDNFTGYLNPEDLDAYMVCVEKDTWEVVVKTGLFSERYRVTSWGDDFNYPRCKVEKFLIKNGAVAKATYNFPEAIQVHPNNWAAPLLQNWYWEKRDPTSFGNLINCDRYGLILGRLVGGSTGFVLNPNINRIHAEYLKRLIHLRDGNRRSRFEQSPSDPNQFYPIQGAELGFDLVDPWGIPSMGCSFFKATNNEIYAIDTGLNQFVPSKNNILIEAIKIAGKAEEIPITLKSGKVEVVHEVGESGTVDLQSQFGNLRFAQQATGIEAKILGLNEPNAIILEAQPNWVDLNLITQSPTPIYYNIYQNSFISMVGESQYEFKGVFTWSEKFPIAWNQELQNFIPSYYDLYSYIPLGGFQLADCNGNLTNPQGYPGVTGGYLSPQDYLQFVSRPRIIGRC